MRCSVRNVAEKGRIKKNCSVFSYPPDVVAEISPDSVNLSTSRCKIFVSPNAFVCLFCTPQHWFTGSKHSHVSSSYYTYWFIIVLYRYDAIIQFKANNGRKRFCAIRNKRKVWIGMCTWQSASLVILCWCQLGLPTVVLFYEPIWRILMILI